jgi:hypothetical protein
LTDIEFIVYLDPQENLIGELEGRTDILDDQTVAFELYASGEGIPARESFAEAQNRGILK